MALQTPLSWLQDFVELSISPTMLAERLTTAGLEVELINLLFLQILHGFTFGATHLGIIHFIGESVSEDISATAMSVYASIMGLAMGLMVIISGHLYAALAGYAYFVVALMSAMGCVLCFYCLLRTR